MNALNAAKRRRAGNDAIPQTPLPSSSSQQPQRNLPGVPGGAPAGATAPASGLTIHQVVALFDKRLNVLEKTIATFMTAAEEEGNSIAVNSPTAASYTDNEMVLEMKATIQSQQATIETLKAELSSLQKVTMELQMYTMSVNKKLLEGGNVFDVSLSASASASVADAAADGTVSSSEMEPEPESVTGSVSMLMTDYYAPIPPMNVKTI